MTQRSSYPWVEVLFVAALLLGGCGPETLPEGLSSQSQVQPSSNRQPAASNTVVASTPTLPVPDTSTPLTPTTGIAQPSPTVAVTTTRSAEIASPIILSLAFTDPATVDIFQIAQELFAAGDVAFPIEVTLGEGEEAMQIRVSMPSNLSLPCIPMDPAPQGKQYTCLMGGGLDTDVWLASWGGGLQRLVTNHGAWTSAWTSDGKKIAVGTWAGKDDKGNIPVKLIDLVTNQEIIVGLMSAPYTLEITQDDRLIYIYDGSIVVQSVPNDLRAGMSLVKNIPVVGLPDNQTYLNGPTAWFKVSPSGDHIAFLQEGYGYESGSLSILDLRDGQETMIDTQVKNLSGALSSVFAWAPSGDTLAYMTMITTVDGMYPEEIYTDRSELWLVDVDGQNRRRLWEVDQPNQNYSDVHWLANGDLIMLAGEIDTWSDLVQVVSVKDGQHQNLLYGAKGLALFEMAPGLAAGLMTNLGATLSHELVVFSYPTD